MEIDTHTSEQTCFLLCGETQPQPCSPPFPNLKLAIFRAKVAFLPHWLFFFLLSGHSLRRKVTWVWATDVFPEAWYST